MSDYDLKAVLKRIKTKPFNFALIKGGESDQVYLSPKPATSKHLDPIMDECGDGKRIAKGLCMWENDQLVFATKAAPSGSWEKMITKIFKDNKCTKYLPISLRQLAESESDEVSFEEGAEGGALSPALIQKLSQQWEAARDEAVRSVEALSTTLTATGNPEAAQAAGIVEQLADGFPTGLDEAFDKLEQELGASSEASPDEARGHVEACLGYLEVNASLIKLCEENPFGEKVVISQPLQQALQSILTELQ